MAVVLKYHAVAAFERIANDLVWVSRGLRRLQGLLASSRQCGFIVVTRPEQLPTLETIRLIEWLAQHRIATTRADCERDHAAGMRSLPADGGARAPPAHDVHARPDLEARGLSHHLDRRDRASAERRGVAGRVAGHVADRRQKLTTLADTNCQIEGATTYPRGGAVRAFHLPSKRQQIS